jgi:DNA-binding transcriptional MerR regulator
MPEIDIGVLASQTDVSTATIRFYESKGLIKSIGRKGLRRQYPRHTIETISLIKLLKKSGLSLKEIGEVFIDQSKINIDRNLIDGKTEQIEKKINSLKNLLVILQHLKSCPYKDHLSCPDFIEMLNSNNQSS